VVGELWIFFWSDDITVFAWVESNLKTVLQGSCCDDSDWELLIFEKKKNEDNCICIIHKNGGGAIIFSWK
jgi:hypothetical protein